MLDSPSISGDSSIDFLLAIWLLSAHFPRVMPFSPNGEKLPRVWIIGKYGNLCAIPICNSRSLNLEGEFPEFMCHHGDGRVTWDRAATCFLNFISRFLIYFSSIDDRKREHLPKKLFKISAYGSDRGNPLRKLNERSTDSLGIYICAKIARSCSELCSVSFILAAIQFCMRDMRDATKPFPFYIRTVFAFLSKLYSNVG